MAAVRACCVQYFRPAQAREADPDRSTLPWPPRKVGLEAHQENKEQAKAEALQIQQKRRKTNYEVLFALIAYSVGIGSVWRLPYFAYRNGGGAFLLVYLLLTVFVGLPVIYLEIALGQFSSLSQIKVWRIAPIARGIGYVGIFVVAFRLIYYPTLMSYAVFYLLGSFTSELPWGTCDNFWNTPLCSAELDALNQTGPLMPVRSPTEEFWEGRVLMRSAGIEEVGGLRWELFLIHIMIWFLTALGVSKGIKSFGKAVYVAATFPPVAMVLLLVRGVTLPGAWEGLKFFLVPDWSALASIRLWTDAMLHVLFSLGIAMGPFINLGSYNKFHNNCQRDAIIIVLSNALNGLLAGIVVFSVLGFIASTLGLPVSDVIQSGAGITYVSFSAGLAKLPVASLWSVIFFLMLFSLGIGSMFGMVNAIVSVIIENFPQLKPRRWIVDIIVCVILGAAGIIVVTGSGIYWINLIEWHCGGYALIIVVLLEIITVMYTYGYTRFADDMYTMLGGYPSWFWVITWNIITPLVMLGLLIARIIGYQRTYYDGYIYPVWADIVGWVLTCSSLAAIPIVAVIFIFRTFTKKGWSFRDLGRPSPKWGPALNVHRHERGLPPLAQNPIELSDEDDFYNDIPQQQHVDMQRARREQHGRVGGVNYVASTNSDSQTPDQPSVDGDAQGISMDPDISRRYSGRPPSYHAQAPGNNYPQLYPDLDPDGAIPTEVLMQQSPHTEFHITDTPSQLNAGSPPQPQIPPSSFPQFPAQPSAQAPGNGGITLPINLQITLVPQEGQPQQPLPPAQLVSHQPSPPAQTQQPVIPPLLNQSSIHQPMIPPLLNHTSLQQQYPQEMFAVTSSSMVPTGVYPSTQLQQLNAAPQAFNPQQFDMAATTRYVVDTNFSPLNKALTAADNTLPPAARRFTSTHQDTPSPVAAVGFSPGNVPPASFANFAAVQQYDPAVVQTVPTGVRNIAADAGFPHMQPVTMRPLYDSGDSAPTQIRRISHQPRRGILNNGYMYA